MIGIPGSGKSTAAANIPNALLVSTDKIREELFGDESNQQEGKKVFDIAMARIEEGLRSGHNVIFDACNVTRKNRKNCFQFPCDEAVAVFVNTPIKECKKRNSNRNRVVPEDVIDRFYSRLQKPSKAEGFSKIIEIKS